MTEPSAPPGANHASVSHGRAGSRAAAGRRIAAVWYRVRSGEDPLAFGAVVLALGLVAGGLWFWAGTHRGDVAAAASPPSSGESAAGVAAGGSGPRVDGAGPSGAGGARTARDHSGSPGGSDSSGGGSGGPAPSGGVAAGGNGSVSPLGPLGATGGSGTMTAPGGPLLAVHVAGAVAHPGLYRLEAGSRVADALARAGGRLARADLDRLNLAARLVDGQKIYVVRRGEPVPPGSAGFGSGDLAPDDGGGGDGTGAAPPEPIDLNAAGLTALDSLPGIGPATARAILEERARRGGFRSTRDLLRVPGIGEGRFARLKDHVRV